LVWATAIIVLETPLSAIQSRALQPLAENDQLRKSEEFPQAMNAGSQILVGKSNFGAGGVERKGFI
jgi:hypothetical protein